MGTVLADCDVIAFVGATDLDRARRFYEGVLGLTLVDENPFACVFDAHGTSLRVTQVGELVAAPYTVLGWTVTNIVAGVAELARSGVTFERYEGMGQDDDGVWASPSGARVAWFKDPDGNTLSLTQPA